VTEGRIREAKTRLDNAWHHEENRDLIEHQRPMLEETYRGFRESLEGILNANQISDTELNILPELEDHLDDVESDLNNSLHNRLRSLSPSPILDPPPGSLTPTTEAQVQQIQERLTNALGHDMNANIGERQAPLSEETYRGIMESLDSVLHDRQISETERDILPEIENYLDNVEAQLDRRAV